MADAKGCRDCGTPVRWTAYEVNAKGEFLRGPDNRAIVHKCAQRPPADRVGQQQGEQEPTMPFGKYKGVTVAKLAETAEGIDYLKWASEHVEKEWLKDAIMAALQGHYGSAMRPVGGSDEPAADSWDE